ncbi:MAG: hypothetical protein AAF063_28095, partial [Cyanobacteria bacterium J06643_5]
PPATPAPPAPPAHPNAYISLFRVAPGQAVPQLLDKRYNQVHCSLFTVHCCKNNALISVLFGAI